MEKPVVPHFEVGDRVYAVNNKPLAGMAVAPPLDIGEEYPVKEVIKCTCGSEHIDVGLASKYNFITCFECGEELPNGTVTHWCHPSRFIKES